MLYILCLLFGIALGSCQAFGMMWLFKEGEKRIVERKRLEQRKQGTVVSAVSEEEAFVGEIFPNVGEV